MKTWKGIVIHWSASHQKISCEEIRKWHKTKGWRDIGYHRVIEHENLYKAKRNFDSLLKEGRTLDSDIFAEPEERGAHAYGYNSDHIGICVIASPEHDISEEQIKALFYLLEVFLKRFGLKKNQVKLHKDLYATECPGVKIEQLVNNWKSSCQCCC